MAPTLLDRHLCARVVPSARVVKRGNRPRAVEVRTVRGIPKEAGLAKARRPDPQYVSHLVERHIQEVN